MINHFFKKKTIILSFRKNSLVLTDARTLRAVAVCKELETSKQRATERYHNKNLTKMKMETVLKDKLARSYRSLLLVARRHSV